MRFLICLSLLAGVLTTLWFIYWYIQRVVLPALKQLEAEGTNVAFASAYDASPELARCEEFAVSGIEWGRWNDSAVTDLLTGLHLNQLSRYAHGSGTLLGPLQVEANGSCYFLFDARFALRYGDYWNDIFATMCGGYIPDLEVPHFYLRPYMPGNRPALASLPTSYDADARFNFYDKIDSVNLLAHRFRGESLLPSRAKAFFETYFAQAELLPFLLERNWTIEFVDSRLVVYQFNQLVPPDQMPPFAADVGHLVELLREASAAYLSELDARLVSAAHRIAEAAK